MYRMYILQVATCYTLYIINSHIQDVHTSGSYMLYIISIIDSHIQDVYTLGSYMLYIISIINSHVQGLNHYTSILINHQITNN